MIHRHTNNDKNNTNPPLQFSSGNIDELRGRLREYRSLLSTTIRRLASRLIELKCLNNV